MSLGAFGHISLELFLSERFRPQQSLFNILNHIVRSGTEPREAVLNFLARTIQLNIKRDGSHVDPATVASDGFMLNLSIALLRFAEPFLDSKFSKVELFHALQTTMLLIVKRRNSWIESTHFTLLGRIVSMCLK